MAFMPYTMTLDVLLRISLVSLLVLTIYFVLIILITRINYKFALKRYKQKKLRTMEKPLVIGFFHPFCDGGAGGEKVLFQAIQAIQNCSQLSKEIQVLVYSASSQSAKSIIQHVKERFGIEIKTNNLEFVKIQQSHLLKPEQYPSFTILWQAIGSVRVSCHALKMMPCDILIDTMGVGFAYAFLKILFGMKIFAYVHYPLVSYDMVKVVASSQTQYNNKKENTNSFIRQQIKMLYYKLLTFIYSFSGIFLDKIVANSSWTYNHILNLWQKPKITSLIYPPCDVQSYINSISAQEQRENLLISLAQFRPEKEHLIQLRVWKKALNFLPAGSRFMLIGTCRDEEDQKIVEELKQFARDAKIEQSVEFVVNKSKDEIKQILKKAKAAIHTMKYEHFGIAIVELMASGIITIAHKSGGPKMDIIGQSDDPVGYLAEDEEEYKEFVVRAIKNYKDNFHTQMRNNARERVKIFGIESFNEQFVDSIQKLI